MEEAERTLDPLRPGHESAPESVHKARVEKAHTFIATEEEAAGFTALLRQLMEDPGRRQELGRAARERAIAHVEERRGLLVKALYEVVAGARGEAPAMI